MTRSAERIVLRLAVSAGLLVLGSSAVLAQHTDPATNAGLQNLTFAAHVNTVFTGPTGLAHASKLLQRCDAIVTEDQDVACNITLAQEGEIGTFGASGDGLDVITTSDELNAVLSNAAAYVKVVTSIEFCDGIPGTFSGCATTPGSSIVIVAGLDEETTGEVIAHHFGHNKGLADRTAPGNPLMSPVPGGDEVNQAECAALHVGLADNGPNVQQDFPPEITCPADVTIECSATGGTPKTDAQLAAFFSSVAADDGCEPAPTITNDAPDLFPVGTTTPVTFTATDSTGNTATCTASVTVVDTTPPGSTVTLDHGSLWPPNHRLVTVAAEVGVTDVCDANPTFTLLSIESSEPENGSGDGNTSPDIVADEGTPDVEFQLRAERQGGGSGRAYTIVYQGADASGNTSDATTCVSVPHDQSGHGGDICSGAAAKKRGGRRR